MDWRRVVYGIIMLCVGMAIGRFFIARPRIQSVISHSTDTITIEKPVPYETKVVEYVYVPEKEVVVINDTIKVPVEKVVYKEREFEATISGIALGDFKPSLDYIKIHNIPRTFIPYATVSLGRNLFSIGGGVTIQEKHGIGIEYLNFRGESVIGGRYTYNF